MSDGGKILLDLWTGGPQRRHHESMLRQQQLMQNAERLKALKAENKFQQGRAEAARMGGLNGVLDYLDKTRPAEALALRAKQNQLNNSYLAGALTKEQIETAKLNREGAKLNLSAKQQELLEKRQQMVGKAYMVINQLPASQRDAMYQKMLPAIKKIHPEAPAKYNTGEAQVAMAQAVPATTLYAASKAKRQAQSDLGKVQADYEYYRERGDSPDAPHMKALRSKQEKAIADSITAQANTAYKQAELMQVEEKRADRLQSTLRPYAKLHYESQQSYDAIMAVGKASLGDPANGVAPNAAAQDALVNGFQRMLSPHGS